MLTSDFARQRDMTWRSGNTKPPNSTDTEKAIRSTYIQSPTLQERHGACHYKRGFTLRKLPALLSEIPPALWMAASRTLSIVVTPGLACMPYTEMCAALVQCPAYFWNLLPCPCLLSKITSAAELDPGCNKGAYAVASTDVGHINDNLPLDG